MVRNIAYIELINREEHDMTNAAQEIAAELNVSIEEAIQIEALALQAFAEAFGSNRQRALAGLAVNRAFDRISSEQFAGSVDRITAKAAA